MKPLTIEQQLAYENYRNDCAMKNAINYALWHERRLAHQIMDDYLRKHLGERNGRT